MAQRVRFVPLFAVPGLDEQVDVPAGGETTDVTERVLQQVQASSA